MIDEKYFIINGVSSLDMNIVVIELPSIAKPKQRVEEIQVLGMNGVLTVSDGTYEPTNKVCKVYYNGNDYDSLIDFLHEKGQVIFSNTPDRYYDYMIISEIPINEIIENEWHEFNIIFRCQPFGYSILNDVITVTNKNTKLFNTGYYSNPTITIYGSGDINLFISDEQITLKGIDEYITINTTKLRTYKDTQRQNEKIIGNYPVLSKGDNNITWDGNITKLEIIPNWRYFI